VRNCDPGADDRMPIDRASPSWNHDRQIDCYGQSSGQRAPSWLFVNMHDSLRRSPSVDGVEPQVADVSPIACAKSGYYAKARGSARHRLRNRPSSWASASFGRPDIRNVIPRFGSVSASGRILPFFSMSKRFISLGRLITTPLAPDRRSTNVGHLNGNVAAATCLRNGLCTHSLIRVSDEKRNADECPATRGKPNCHR
jgi:hypothetical protein